MTWISSMSVANFKIARLTWTMSSVLKAKFRQLNTDLKFDISSIRICTESY
jgi:hypothetical protein